MFGDRPICAHVSKWQRSPEGDLCGHVFRANAESLYPQELFGSFVALCFLEKNCGKREFAIEKRVTRDNLRIPQLASDPHLFYGQTE